MGVRPRLNQKLMLTPTCFMVAIMDLDMDTTDILMLTTERGQLMLSLRLMPTPTSCMVDTMDIPMLTMARGLLMLNQRLMPTPTSSMVDTMDLDTMVLDMDTTDTLMLIMARDLLMPN